MQVRNEIRLLVFTMLGLLIASALAGVGLLARTAPLVEQILAENDFSIEAGEGMLTILAHASPDEAAPPTARAEFDRLLARAQANITEEDEQSVVDAIAADRDAVLAGDPLARLRMIDALATLSRLNRESMQRADERAERLATAGSWTAFGSAGLAMLLSLILIRRARDKLERPIDALYRVARASLRGDGLARCRDRGMPLELDAVAKALNALLEKDTEDRAPSAPSTDRDVLLAVLDAMPGAVFIVDRRGALLAANRDGLAALEVRGSSVAELVESPPAGAEVDSIGNGLTRLRLAEGHEPG